MAKKNIKEVKENTISIKDYTKILINIREQIDQSKMQAFVSINFNLNRRNWLIGKIIAEEQKKHKWGSTFIEKVAKDLQSMYPGNAGFSSANVYRMKAFYEAYSDISHNMPNLEELPVSMIPWSSNIVILQKIKDTNERLWYAQKSIENNWTRETLETKIKNNLFSRDGKAITNFKKILPDPHSTAAQQTFVDPYIFDFVKLEDDHVEYELEQSLINNVQKLLLEMGKGFALVGRQYHIKVGNKDNYLDLLFYHITLKCFVVVELKTVEFIPEFAGKLNYYLSAVDDFVKRPDDKPTIGLLLCKTKDDFQAEYALRDVNKPIGVASYEIEIIKKLPKNLKSQLPTIEEIEEGFEKNEELNKDKISKKKNSTKTKKTK